MKYVEKKLFSFANEYMNRFTNTHQNGNYWAMSPSNFNATNAGASEFYQSATGCAYDSWVTHGDGLRPVIKEN